jgi:hypothetical protein
MSAPPTNPSPAPANPTPTFPDEVNADLKMQCACAAGIAAALRCGALPAGLATDAAVIAARNRKLEEYRFQYAMMEKVFDQQTSTNPDVDFGWQNIAVGAHAAAGSLGVNVQTPSADVMAALAQIAPLFKLIPTGTPLGSAAQVLAALQGTVNVNVPPGASVTAGS